MNPDKMESVQSRGEKTRDIRQILAILLNLQKEDEYCSEFENSKEIFQKSKQQFHEAIEDHCKYVRHLRQERGDYRSQLSKMKELNRNLGEELNKKDVQLQMPCLECSEKVQQMIKNRSEYVLKTKAMAELLDVNVQLTRMTSKFEETKKTLGKTKKELLLKSEELLKTDDQFRSKVIEVEELKVENGNYRDRIDYLMSNEKRLDMDVKYLGEVHLQEKKSLQSRISELENDLEHLKQVMKIREEAERERNNRPTISESIKEKWMDLLWKNKVRLRNCQKSRQELQRDVDKLKRINENLRINQKKRMREIEALRSQKTHVLQKLEKAKETIDSLESLDAQEKLVHLLTKYYQAQGLELDPEQLFGGKALDGKWSESLDKQYDDLKRSVEDQMDEGSDKKYEDLKRSVEDKQDYDIHPPRNKFKAFCHGIRRCFHGIRVFCRESCRCMKRIYKFTRLVLHIIWVILRTIKIIICGIICGIIKMCMNLCAPPGTYLMFRIVVAKMCPCCFDSPMDLNQGLKGIDIKQAQQMMKAAG